MKSVIADIRKHTEELEAVAKKGEELRKALRQAIADLPDNPAAQRVERSPHCFTVSSRAVFGDPKNNPTKRLDVFFHDFTQQYEMIARTIDVCEQANVLRTLTSIAETGAIKKTGNDYRRFHPQVVNHIRTLIGLPADFSPRQSAAAK